MKGPGPRVVIQVLGRVSPVNHALPNMVDINMQLCQHLANKQTDTATDLIIVYIYIYYVSIELFICPNYKGLVTGHFFTLDLGPGIT